MASDVTQPTLIRDTFHSLKTWPEYFDAVDAGRKPFEVRRADRDFQVGDVLLLHRWEPDSQDFTRDSDGLPIMRAKRVTYILQGGQFGIEPGFCVMGIEDVKSA